MYGKTKRALSLVLALSMLLSLFTMSVSASSTDNTLELDAVEQVTVTAGVSTPVYFTPTESGAYWFESLTGYDAYANLYDDQDNYLAYEDWGGMDQNFGFYFALEAGVTYRLEVSYCVDSSTPEEATIPVVVRRSIVASVVAQPVSLMVGTKGNIWNSGTPEAYFNYDWRSNMTYTVTFTNGDVQTYSSYDFYYEGQYYNVVQEGDDGQSYNTQWEVGKTYTPTFSIAGCKANASVTITASPVASVSVNPITVIEGSGFTNYGWDYENDREVAYHYYDWFNKISCMVTFNDGTTQQITGSGFNYNGEHFGIPTMDNQNWNTPWTVGNTYTATINIMGREVQVDVSVVPSPIKSVVANPLSIKESESYPTTGWDSETGQDVPYQEYSWYWRASYTITFTDDSVLYVNGSSFQYNGETHTISFRDDQYWDNPWTAGNTYIGIATIMGIEVEVPVTITPLPVVSIDVQPVVLAENTGGYLSNHWDGQQSHEYYHYYWWQNMTTEITFIDGSTRIVVGTGFYYDNEWFNLSYQDTQSYADPFLPGQTYTATVTCGKAQDQVEITIAEPLESNGFEYIVQNDDAIITNCTKTDKSLTIPETLGGKTVTGIVYLGNTEELEELILPDSLTMLSGPVMETPSLKHLHLGAGIRNFSMDMLWRMDSLEEITVSQSNPWYTSVDGVVYDKAVTCMVAYPQGRMTTHVIPDSVTDLTVIFGNVDEGGYGSHYVSSGVNVVTGAGTPEYVTVDGVVYNADMTCVYACAAEKNGRYVMPESVVTMARYALAKSNLDEVVISPNVTTISYGSFTLSNLKKIQIPASVDTIGPLAFEYCDDIQEVHIEDLAGWCNTYMEGENPLAVAGNLYLNGSKVTDLVIPAVVTSVYYGVFENANLNSITVPSTVKSIESYAFRGTTAKTLSLAEGLEYLGYRAFGESAITSVDLPDSLVYMEDRVFQDCTDLTSATIGTGLEAIAGSAFANTGLTSITIPQNVGYVGHSAFEDSPLKEVVFENDAIEIGYAAFSGCPLEEINLGDNVSYIEDKAFQGNKAVTLQIPESVTYITYRSFYDSDNLISVSVPETVEGINFCAFDHCDNLTCVYYGGTEEQWFAMREYSPHLQAATVHYEAEGDEFTVERTDTQIKHYCQLCRRWTTIQLEAPGELPRDGWVQESGKWCFYQNGAKLTNTWKKDATDWCYLGADGYMVTNSWMKDSQGWCYLGSSGYMVRGQWIEENDEKYYIGSNGYMVTGTQTIGGKEYKFASSGKLLKYTITFFDYNGAILTQDTYFHGDTVASITPPARQADHVGSYTFAGWDKDVTAAIKDDDYVAQYDIAYKDYTVTFIGWNEKVIETQTLHWGDEIDPPIVVNEEDEDYYYYFAEWDKELVPVAGDATYTAQYEREEKPELNGWVSQYGEWFYYVDGMRLTNQWVEDSKGWCYLGVDGAMVTDNWVNNDGLYYVDATGHPILNKWKKMNGDWYYLGGDGRAVTNTWIKDSKGWCYLGEGGEMLTEQWLNDGEDKYYLDATGHMVTGTVTIGGVAYKFAPSGALKKHTITFCGHDGTVISETVYFYGETVLPPQPPVRAEDQVGTYAFSGWDKTISAVAGDTTYTATYNVSYKDYTVTFYDNDGDVIDTHTYHWGDTVTPPTVSNYEDDSAVYTFASWDKTLATVAGDASYTATYTAKLKEGWIKDGDLWTYYLQGQKVVDDWVQHGAWYYMDENGYMVTEDWRMDDIGWCYLGADGKMQVNKWIRQSEAWCYVDASGHMVTNKWVKDSAGWCYIGDSGYMARNTWVQDSIGWCYLNENGRMVYNDWIEDQFGWRYVDKTGYAVSGKWIKDSAGWCYLGDDGYMVTEQWLKDRTGWCYVGADGHMVFDQWLGDEAGDRYVDNAGYLVTDRWVKNSIGWRYAGDDGYMVAEQWLKDRTGWCYVGFDTYQVFNEWVADSKGLCYIDGSGYMVTAKWVKDVIGWSYVDANGHQVSSKWIKDSKGWCYVGENGYMIYSDWVADSKGWCYLDANGRMVYDKWVDNDNSYVNASGYKVMNKWVKRSGNWYYMDENGCKLTDTSRQIGNKTYHFDANGICTNP